MSIFKSTLGREARGAGDPESDLCETKTGRDPSPRKTNLPSIWLAVGWSKPSLSGLHDNVSKNGSSIDSDGGQHAESRLIWSVG